MLLEQRLNENTRQSGSANIRTYQDWLAKHQPLSEAEMQYLDDPNDVVSLLRNGREDSSKRTGPTPVIILFVVMLVSLPLVISGQVQDLRMRLLAWFIAGAMLITLEMRYHAMLSFGWEFWAVFTSYAMLTVVCL